MQRAVYRGRDKEGSSEHPQQVAGGRVDWLREARQGKAEWRGKVPTTNSTGSLNRWPVPLKGGCLQRRPPKGTADSEKPHWPVSGLFSRGNIFGTGELLNPEDIHFCSWTYNCVTQKAPSPVPPAKVMVHSCIRSP